MYLDHFKLKAEPFGITPDPDFLFMSPSHKEALASIIYGIRMRKGFVSVTGEAGVGKTTVVRSCLDRLNKREVKVVYLFNSNITFPALLKTIFRELELEPKSGSVSDTIDQLHRELIEFYSNNINVVLIIDEAQNMPAATLENLRMLSNIETAKEKLLQIIFCGQPEFDRLLDRHDLRQLRQRIALRVRIKRLTRGESRSYIRHRLTRASASDVSLFTRSAVTLIVRRSAGIPRTINILCGNALVTAFGCNKNRAGYRAASEAVADMSGAAVASPIVAYGGVLLAILLVVAAFRLAPVAFAKFSSTGFIRQPYRTSLPDNSTNTVTKPGDTAENHLHPKINKGLPETKETSIPSVEQSRPTTPDISKQPKQTQTVSRVVGKGDTLSRMTTQIYGTSNDELVTRVARCNPGIKDVNMIFEGESIVFPVN